MEYIISTESHIFGYKIIGTKGFVYGLTVRSKAVIGEISDGLKNIVSGKNLSLY
ncbi:hypothetical protein MBBAR_6c00240 [Methanobrevibacter arboriphilus JCM 13429 = DSM 1125]|uniref:Uncharacterized protein n=1 Tax=Methanobrevibacter arboriphilus JCM 13429 = DSM 1125 TaxID=1300164 RepID=A0A1V6N2N3_METAZ|nr:heavy metal-binding domain-containing protein [Methanobrevibacter arboriphilus]OQD58914.1 hypothetical protein MBBAR_6c00240 [Methanobrevibacter arboriphilus JCM 13429 = DSM 1125]